MKLCLAEPLPPHQLQPGRAEDNRWIIRKEATLDGRFECGSQKHWWEVEVSLMKNSESLIHNLPKYNPIQCVRSGQIVLRTKSWSVSISKPFLTQL